MPKIRSDQSWMTVHGATLKAASPAGPPTSMAQSSTSASGPNPAVRSSDCGKKLECNSARGPNP